MIKHFFTKDLVIRRLKTVSGSKKQFASTATVEGHIQAMDREARQRLNIIEERAWYVWMDIDADIQEGDELIDEDNVTYLVKEITKKDYGTNVHLQVIIEQATI